MLSRAWRFFLIKAGSGALTLGVPDSPGVPPGTAAGTLTAAYNNLESVRNLFASYRDKVAAVIVGPVVGNMGCVPPEQGFLQELRDLCTVNGSLLIFDEVMTGFRVARGGAQQLYGVTPDLTTLAKIIGGGLPVGAYGGRKDIMDMVAPSGPMYQAGTLSGNPLAMAAGLETLSIIMEDEMFYSGMEGKAARLECGCTAGDRQPLAAAPSESGRLHVYAVLYPACGAGLQNGDCCRPRKVWGLLPRDACPGDLPCAVAV